MRDIGPPYFSTGPYGRETSVRSDIGRLPAARCIVAAFIGAVTRFQTRSQLFAEYSCVVVY